MDASRTSPSPSSALAETAIQTNRGEIVAVELASRMDAVIAMLAAALDRSEAVRRLSGDSHSEVCADARRTALIRGCRELQRRAGADADLLNGLEQFLLQLSADECAIFADDLDRSEPRRRRSAAA